MADPVVADDPWLRNQAKPEDVEPVDPWMKNQTPPKKPTFLGGLANAVTLGADDVMKAVKGRNEFNYPEIGTVMSGADFDQRNALGLDFARGNEAMLDVLRKQDPGLKQSKDKYGNDVILFKGKPYYLNRGGASERDLREFGRDAVMQVAPAVAATALTGGAALPIRAAAQAIAGGVGSVATDIASKAAGSEQPIDMGAMIISALGGAGGEAVGSALNGVIRTFTQRPAAFVTPQGTLTPQGIRVATEAGLDVNAMSEQLARTFAERVREVGPTAAARTARADEFGLRLTPGQASGDVNRQAFEEAAENGARGTNAANLMRERTDAMQQSVQDSRGRVTNQLAPGAQTATREESADLVQQGVQDRYAYDNARKDALWDNARDEARAVRIPRRELTTLPDFVRAEMRRGDPVHVVPDLHKASNAAMDVINQAGAGTIEDLSTRSGNAIAGNLGVTFEAVDSAVRKRLSFLNKSAMADPADRMAFGRIIRGYENWLDHLEDSALMGAAPDALANIREARAASRDLFQMYGERAPNARSGTTDKAGQTLERMIHDNVDTNEVGNWLWGKVTGGGQADARRLVERIHDIIEPGSPERDALKRGLLQATLMVPEGKTQPGAQKLAQNIFELVNGKGGPLAREVFDADEIAMLRRYGAALRDTVRDPRATNPSKSAYAVARSVIDAVGGMGGPLRMLQNVTIDAGNIVRAASTQPARMRTTPSALVPALGALGAERRMENRSDEE